MREQKIRGKRRYRWLAGLFCVSLFLGEILSAGLVASAQENTPAAQDFTLQENDSEGENPGDKEGEGENPGGEEGEGENPDGEEGGEGNPSGGEGEGENPGGEEGEGENPGGEEGEGENPDGDTEQESDGEGNDDGTEEEPSVSESSPEEDASVPENTLSENTPEESGLCLLSAGDDIAGGSYEKVTWVIRANGELIVDGEGEFAPSVPKTDEPYERAPWYARRAEIKSATVRLTGAKDLSGMFAGCKNMTTVNLSGLRTDTATNMSEMFADCNELRKLDLSGFNTSNVTDMSKMFYNCNCWRLEKLDLSGFDTSNVTDMSGMFALCSNWEELDLSGFDTSKVTDMREMFAYCQMMSKLNLSGFNTSNVKDMSGMFRNFWALEKLDLSGFDTSNVTDMSEMFTFSAFKKLDLSGFNTSNVTDMSDMFGFCSHLTELNMSGFNTSNVTDMSSMFRGCESLTELDLSGFNTSNVTDMSSMFSICVSLTELNLSGFNTSNVTNMSEMFSSCRSLTEPDLSGFNTSNVTDMGGMFIGLAVRELDLRHFNTSQVKDMGFMFASCKNLTELDLRYFDTSNVTNMDSMFAGCESLVELDLSNFDTSNVLIMGSTSWVGTSGMFTGCKKLERLDVSSFDTYSASMIAMFDGCESLKELDLSSFKMVWKEESYKFFLRNCNSLETLYAPRSVKADVPLPKAKDSDVWRGVINGEQVELTELPKGLSDNVLLVKNKTQEQVEDRIEAKKGRTFYSCGDSISLDDLKVTYYGTSARPLSADDYTTNKNDIDMSTPGEKNLVVTYEREGRSLTAELKLRVIYRMTEENTTITLPTDNFDYTYTGKPIKPIPTVVCRISGKEVTLEEGTDYVLSYWNNIEANASEPVVAIMGQGNYSGTFIKNFAISKAAPPAEDQILCYAADCDSAAAGRTIELSGSFAGSESKTGYRIVSVTEDNAIEGAVLSRTPVDADISSDGTLTYSTNAGTPGDFATVKLKVTFANYEDADLTVKIVLSEERVAYMITYDTMGHGGSSWTKSVKAGSLIGEPEPLTEAGYLFTGWYTDRYLAKKWNFATDVVQKDVTLYAGWLSDRSEGRLQMYIQDVDDMSYTGNAIKPTVVVYDSDGKTLLKAGKDYTVKYYNNVKAGGAETAGAVAKAVNPGKKNETLTNIVPGGEVSDHDFTKSAPYIAITGKGNYTETIYKNFCILPADIGTPDAAPAQGFTLKYTDQLVTNGKKEQKPFSSIKYKKAMKAGVDFQVSIGAIEALDAEGQAVPSDWKLEGSGANKQNPAIPKGYSGMFLLTIKGQGNYTGEICRTVFVNSKEKLIKNASITLGKNQKSRPYTGQEVTLTDFSVKEGKMVLSCGQDYTVSYANNVAVGTATMTITGKGMYAGSKSVTFKITGTKFAADNILVKSYDKNNPNENDFKSSMPYTGSAVLQNRVTLSTKATKTQPSMELVYGKHYTISYKNNVKKGTATMTFTAKPESGYSGSFKKTFKITAQPLAQENLTVEKTADSGEVQAAYRKNGAVPSFVLTNAAGVVLTQGKDYTVKCKNNTTITTAQMPESKKPVMTITGKGSYAGKLEVPFNVVQESLETAIENGDVKISCTAVMKKKGMKFKDFKFKLMEGKKALAVGRTKDYTLDETNCTPDKLLAYAQALEAGTASSQTEPSVTITGTGVNYTGTITVPLGRYLYAGKLENSNLYVVVSEGKDQNTYTGVQLRPDVAVYYGGAKAVSKAKKAKEKDGAVLTAADGSYQLIKLTEDIDYTLVYGANTTAGNNKGSVKVTGIGKYGGSVTVKFKIEKKSVCTVTAQTES